MSKCKSGSLIQALTVSIPIGLIDIKCCSRGLHWLKFNKFELTDSSSIQILNSDHCKEESVDKILNFLEDYFSSSPCLKLPPICWNGICQTESFSHKVLSTLYTQIQFGQTVSYKGLAEMAGHASAHRAVGTVMRKNPVALVIPCHRVVKSSRQIGNYNGGNQNEIKQWLLEHEQSI